VRMAVGAVMGVAGMIVAGVVVFVVVVVVAHPYFRF
jgi:hypothetical protein